MIKENPKVINTYLDFITPSVSKRITYFLFDLFQKDDPFPFLAKF